MNNNILTQKELTHLKHAIELAQTAVKVGDAPFGAVIYSDRILAATHNLTVAEGDPTLHAEMVAIREACRKHGVKSLVGSTIYSSCEPCLMCLYAIYYAQISKVVFAATLEDAINYGSGDPFITTAQINKQGNLNLQLIVGPGREEVISIFEQRIKNAGHL